MSLWVIFGVEVKVDSDGLLKRWWTWPSPDGAGQDREADGDAIEARNDISRYFDMVDKRTRLRVLSICPLLGRVCRVLQALNFRVAVTLLVDELDSRTTTDRSGLATTK